MRLCGIWRFDPHGGSGPAQSISEDSMRGSSDCREQFDIVHLHFARVPELKEEGSARTIPPGGL